MATRKRHGRNRRYWSYRQSHFTPSEARELSVLRRLDYNEVRRMRRVRMAMWEDFVSTATDMEKRGEWHKSDRMKHWVERVRFWYVDNDFIKPKEASTIYIGKWRFSDRLDQHNIWFWFDYVRSQLPVEKQYGAAHKAKKYLTPQEKKARADREREKLNEEQMTARIMDNLFQRVTDYPDSDRRLTLYARNYYGFKGASLHRTARKRGYGR